MDNIRVLLVEDDLNLGTLLREYLNAKGYQTDLYNNGVDGFRAFMKQQYDICILDVMMPQKDGFTLGQEIRELNSEIPLMFLTAKSMQDDILKGFKMGADDYMTKPFSMQELIFRIEAILRRTKKETHEIETDIYQIGKYTFDTQKRLLTYLNQEPIKLTTKESELLRLLVININDVLERNVALENVWYADNYFNARSMDVYITKLRKHLRQDPTIEIINVHGKGFKLIAN